MPFPNNIALNNLNDYLPIGARDIDFSNTNISFFMNSTGPNINGLSISWLSMDSQDRKKYWATIITNAVLNIIEEQTFNLYATVKYFIITITFS